MHGIRETHEHDLDRVTHADEQHRAVGLLDLAQRVLCLVRGVSHFGASCANRNALLCHAMIHKDATKAAIATQPIASSKANTRCASPSLEAGCNKSVVLSPVIIAATREVFLIHL